MTSDKLTIVIGYRNRDVGRVERCLRSLAGQTRDEFNVHFVDYGSHLSLARRVQSLVGTFAFCRYIYSDTRGWPWSRAKALNIGIRLTETEYVLTTDADIIFATNFVETVLNVQDGSSAIYCAPRWLPSTFANWQHVYDFKYAFPKGDRNQLGGCQCVPTATMLKLGGFDEFFEYWGLEDHDVHDRLIMSGLQERWVDDRTTMFHQWHAATRGGVPRSYLRRWIDPYRQAHRFRLRRNEEGWGRITRTTDRPLFASIPEATSEEPVSWPGLLQCLGAAVRSENTAPRWFITDRSDDQQYSGALQAGYRCAVASVPRTASVVLGDAKMERETEQAVTSALRSIRGVSNLKASVIVVSLAPFLRVSLHLFEGLLDTTISGGIVAFTNLGDTVPPADRLLLYSVLSTPLRWACRLPARATLRLKQQSFQMLETLEAVTFCNNLRDSIYLARVNTAGILDFTLDFPSANTTAVFMKE